MREKFIELFHVPEAAVSYLDVFFTEEEMDFAESLDREIFSEEDARRILPGDAVSFLRHGYQSGLLSLEAEETPLYRLNNFYGSLDVFCVSQRERYLALPETVRRALDDWYFDAYMDGLDPNPQVRPTQDEILTLEETLDFIDSQGDRPVYLNECDCRSLSGDCGFPTRTCISYRTGINTFAHRGLSEAIDREKAKDIVREADRAGLMHTVNSSGICNCCGDCCYLFRGQERRGSRGFWPRSFHLVSYDPAACVLCGKCIRRCHFDVFSRERASEGDRRGQLTVHPAACVGCGLCVTGCPTGALSMESRE